MQYGIPTEEQAEALWEKYDLPQVKRQHVQLVARVALYLADKLTQSDRTIHINQSLLRAGALLHDIDKNIPSQMGEQHPDTGVRILHQEGMAEVAQLVKSHPLHAILDPAIAPKTWEEKLLFLADKMVKYDVSTVDTRFEFWNDEHLPKREQDILDAAYPKVKELESDILGRLRLKPEDIARALT